MSIHEEQKTSLEILWEQDRKFAGMGPKDLRKVAADEKAITLVQFSKTTSMDGEQMSVQIPIYELDSREDVNNRVKMLVSVIIGRMTEVNEAMLAAEEAGKIPANVRELLEKKAKAQ